MAFDLKSYLQREEIRCRVVASSQNLNAPLSEFSRARHLVVLPPFSIELTPHLIYSMRQSVADPNATCYRMITHSAVWVNFMSGANWPKFFKAQPYESVSIGHVGNLCEVEVWTDAFAPPHCQVIDSGMLYMASFVGERITRIVGAHVAQNL